MGYDLHFITVLFAFDLLVITYMKKKLKSGMKFLHTLKQFVFGTKLCTCNKRRKDGLHNVNCASWQNAWHWEAYKKRLIQEK